MPTLLPNRSRWSNPLIVPALPALNRRQLLLAGGASALVAYTAASDLLADENARDITGDDEAVVLLRDAAQVMSELDSFRFRIETVSGESTILTGLTLESIEGGVRRPYDFVSTIVVGVPFGTVTISAAGLDGMAWLQNPLDPGTWIPLDDLTEVVALVNPDALILAAIDYINDATIDGTDRLGGIEATRIAGTIDFSEAASWLGETDPMFPAQVSSDPLDVFIWIDDEARVLEIEVVGPILTSESESVIRSIRFFDFNEPIEIETPEI